MFGFACRSYGFYTEMTYMDMVIYGKIRWTKVNSLWYTFWYDICCYRFFDV